MIDDKVNPNIEKVLIEVEAMGVIKVLVDVVKAEAYATEIEGLPFGGNGCVGHDGELVAVTNDITTNYLEVAMVKAMQFLGIRVKPKRPYPLNRKFTIIEPLMKDEKKEKLKKVIA